MIAIDSRGLISAGGRQSICLHSVASKEEDIFLFVNQFSF